MGESAGKLYFIARRALPRFAIRRQRFAPLRPPAAIVIQKCIAELFTPRFLPPRAAAGHRRAAAAMPTRITRVCREEKAEGSNNSARGRYS